MKIINFTSKKEFVNESVKFILNLIKHNPDANIGLSGGKTPEPIYTELAKHNLRNSTFYTLDERYIDKNHESSNYGMIKKSDLKNIIHFNTTLNIEKSLQEYAKQLPKQFDLIILGLGPDGHIVSLFPNTKELDSNESVIHTTTNMFEIKDRLTITYPLILNAKKILLIANKSKKEALDKFVNENIDYHKFPISKLKEHQNLTIHFLEN